ncbi:MAG: protein kinase, partial [Proteobacteria bacterium]|nr:protein kinase [Pseudomonadota bacterium]
MTPDYASPEQIDGAALTTASDVYSLGVILCELLSGKRPYELKRDSRRALEEAILLAKPARPSDLAAPTDCRALRGDLDTIVHKALKKDPSERYATVDAFAEDVQRFLQGHPVRARPDSTWYRTRRFVKRHRIGVAISATVMVAILGGSGFAITQMLEAQKQRDAALASQRVSRAFGEFLVFLLQDAGDSPKTAKQLLDRGVELLERRPNQDDSTI